MNACPILDILSVINMKMRTLLSECAMKEQTQSVADVHVPAHPVFLSVTMSLHIRFQCVQR